jgi:hypothetical protein
MCIALTTNTPTIGERKGEEHDAKHNSRDRRVLLHAILQVVAVPTNVVSNIAQHLHSVGTVNRHAAEE